MAFIEMPYSQQKNVTRLGEVLEELGMDDQIMKNFLIVAVLCALTACSTTVPVSNSPLPQSATNSGLTTDNRAIPKSLPFVEENSNWYLRTGQPKSEQTAAFEAFRSGDPWKLIQPHKLVQLGKFRLRMRQVRLDRRDFVVVEMASNSIGARRFDLRTKTLQAAQAQTHCRVIGTTYSVRDGAKSGIVLPLAC